MLFLKVKIQTKRQIFGDLKYVVPKNVRFQDNIYQDITMNYTGRLSKCKYFLKIKLIFIYQFHVYANLRQRFRCRFDIRTDKVSFEKSTLHYFL